MKYFAHNSKMWECFVLIIFVIKECKNSYVSGSQFCFYKSSFLAILLSYSHEFSPQSRFPHKEVNNERPGGVCLVCIAHTPRSEETFQHPTYTLIPVNSSLLFVYQVRHGIYLRGTITLWSSCIWLSNLKYMKVCESSVRHAVAGWCFILVQTGYC